MKLISILYIIALSVFVSCNNSSKEESKELTEKQAVNNNETSEINKYLIEPPDTSYTGEYIDKYPNGNTKFRGYFRFGKRHGQWMAFYADGTLWSECFYDKGAKQGLNKVYYENGKPRYYGFFKNDLRDSTWIFFDEQGNELNRIKFLKDQQLTGN